MVAARLFCVGDVAQIVKVNKRRKPTSRRKRVTEKTQREKNSRRRKGGEEGRGRKREQKVCGWVNEQALLEEKEQRGL